MTLNKFLLRVPIVAVAMAASAQQSPQLTAKDYEHAESFLNYNTAPFIDHDGVRAEWLPADKFWYRTLTSKGSEFILVDAVKASRSVAFDQQKLALSLSKAGGKQY